MLYLFQQRIKLYAGKDALELCFMLALALSDLSKIHNPR